MLFSLSLTNFSIAVHRLFYAEVGNRGTLCFLIFLVLLFSGRNHFVFLWIFYVLLDVIFSLSLFNLSFYFKTLQHRHCGEYKEGDRIEEYRVVSAQSSIYRPIYSLLSILTFLCCICAWLLVFWKSFFCICCISSFPCIKTLRWNIGFPFTFPSPYQPMEPLIFLSSACDGDECSKQVLFVWMEASPFRQFFLFLRKYHGVRHVLFTLMPQIGIFSAGCVVVFFAVFILTKKKKKERK